MKLFSGSSCVTNLNTILVANDFTTDIFHFHYQKPCSSTRYWHGYCEITLFQQRFDKNLTKNCKTKLDLISKTTEKKIYLTPSPTFYFNFTFILCVHIFYMVYLVKTFKNTPSSFYDNINDNNNALEENGLWIICG